MISEQAEGTSGDQGAENVLHKTLTPPLEEARAVEKMLADGYTVDGAATVLGWHKRRVTARQRILRPATQLERRMAPAGAGRSATLRRRHATSRPGPR